MGVHLHRRIAQKDAARRGVGHDLGRAARDHVIADEKVIPHAALAAQHDPVADTRGPGDADLATEQRVAPHLDVMGDVDEVIELGAGPDLRRPDGAAVDGAIGADLHIVADLHRAERMDAQPALLADLAPLAKGLADLLHPRFLGRDEGIAVRADHRARLADEPVADPHPRADPGAGMDQRPAPDLCPLGDGHMGRDTGLRADPHTLADHHEGADGRTGANHGRGVDDGGRVDAGRDLRAGIEGAGQARHGQTRPRDEDRGAQAKGGPIRTVPEDRGLRRTLRQPVGIGGVHGKGEVLRPGHRRLGRAGHAELNITLGAGIQRAGDLGNRIGHGGTGSRPGSGPGSTGFSREPRAIPPRPPEAR